MNFVLAIVRYGKYLRLSDMMSPMSVFILSAVRLLSGVIII